MHIIVYLRTSMNVDEPFIPDTELEQSEYSPFLFVVPSLLPHHTYTHIEKEFLYVE